LPIKSLENLLEKSLENERKIAVKITAYICQRRIDKGFDDPIVILDDGYVRHTEALVLRDARIYTHMGRHYFEGIPVAEGSDATDWLTEVTRNNMILDFQRVMPHMFKPFDTPQVLLDYGHAYYIPPRAQEGRSVKTVNSK
jgi:hypothetical protein